MSRAPIRRLAGGRERLQQLRTRAGDRLDLLHETRQARAAEGDVGTGAVENARSE